VLLSLLAGWYLERFLSPIKKNYSSGKITGSRIGLRLNEGKRTDEVNSFLSGLIRCSTDWKKLLIHQKAFVMLRTNSALPCFCTGQNLGYRSWLIPEAKRITRVKSVLDDIQQLNKATNNL
jgi:hypothetical protein